MDSGWGLRGLSAKESGYNPFGHRSGAVRVHETAIAAAGLAAAGHEQAAGALARGVLDAADSFGYRLPEMYAGEQRTTGGAPVPHPAAAGPPPWRRAAQCTYSSPSRACDRTSPPGRCPCGRSPRPRSARCSSPA